MVYGPISLIYFPEFPVFPVFFWWEPEQPQTKHKGLEIREMFEFSLTTVLFKIKVLTQYYWGNKGIKSYLLVLVLSKQNKNNVP